jgi:hypothetical protein
MPRKLWISVAAIALAAGSAGAIAAASGDGGGSSSQGATSAQAAKTPKGKKALRFEDHDLFIEFNATDRDAGVQLNLDGEDWTRLKIRDPKGDVLLNIAGRNQLGDNGLTELFFESAEPPLSEVPFSKFKKRFPEGKYTFRGRTVEDRRIVASDRFSHLVPEQPNITSPRDGATVDSAGFTTDWDPVTKPAGVRIARYIVIVTQGTREMTMPVPASATSATIPGQFLRPNADVELEVLSREESGNQTITAVEFKTR